MQPLTAAQVVQLWEWGQDKHPLDQALLLLKAACPDLSLAQLQELSIGQRNSRLLLLREQTLGSTLNGQAACPQCRVILSLSIPVAALRLPEPETHEYRFEQNGTLVRFRLLNSLDMAAVVGIADVGAVRQRLIEYCVLEANHAGQSLAASALPDPVLAGLMDALAEHDPQADMRFDLVCAACGYRWSALFDIVPFFWDELTARAKRLMYDVHRLATAYGWREADILAMSEARRHFYHELVGA